MNYLKQLALITLSAVTIYASSQAVPSGMNLGSLNHLSSSSAFYEAISNPMVVIKFGANWCGPCRQLTPILKSLAAQFNQVLFVEVDIDQFKSLSSQYSVRSIPTVIMFKDGNQVSRTTGSESLSFWTNKITTSFGL